MKKFAALALVSLPAALMSSAYAQSTNSTAAPNPPTSSSSTTTTTAPEGTPSGPGNNRAADGNANAPATSPAAPGNGTTAAPAAGTNGTTGTMPPTNADSGTMTDAISGWSIKDKLMGKSVYNENDQKVGDISDIVLSTDGKSTYFIVGVGGFIGMGERKVAIPFDKISPADNKLVLQGYTKDQLKAMPEFKLAE